MNRTTTARIGGIIGCALAFVLLAGMAGAVSRDDINAQKRADQRRGYNGNNINDYGSTRTSDRNRPSDPRTNVNSRNINPPSNLTPEQQKIIDERRKRAEAATQTGEERPKKEPSGGAAKPGGQPPTAGVPKLTPPTTTAPGGGVKSTGGKGPGKSIESMGGGNKAGYDPGWLTLALVTSTPEGTTDSVRLTVNLNNTRSVAFDTVEFTLKYDPKCLEFVPPESATRAVALGGSAYLEDDGSGYPHALVRAATDGYINYVDERAGLIRYLAHSVNRDPLKSQGPVADMTFRFKNNTQSPVVGFAYTPETVKPWDVAVLDASHGIVASATRLAYLTMVTEKGEDRLGDRKSWGDGALEQLLFFRRDLTSPSERRSVYLPDDYDSSVSKATPEDHGVRILLVPSVASVAVGEEFDMVVNLDNPNHVEFDTFGLFLAYNPRTLLPLDHDKDNWIRSGINVFDGEYRGAFPFDLQVQNSIDRESGLVDYQMKKMFDPLRGEGTIASIRFTALTAISATRLKLLFHVAGESPTTGVFRMGKDVLGWSDDLTDGVEFVSIEIREPEERAVAQLPASQ